MAKDKLLRFLRVLVGGYDLSGDAREIGTIGGAPTQVPMTGWSNAVQNFLAGRREYGVTGFQAFLNDTASSGAHSVLKAPASSNQVSFMLGSMAEPTVGDPAYVMPAMEFSAPTTFNEQAAVLTADFMPDASQTVPAEMWGIVLQNGLLSATTNGTSVNNGASSANGGHANLHVTATASGNFANKVQDSANDADWADLITFSADGSAVTSENGTVSGTVDQYTRFQATRTGGTETVACTFVRN